jgi:hypothetical protein
VSVEVTIPGALDVDIDIDGNVSVAMLDFVAIQTVVVRCAVGGGVSTFSFKLTNIDRQIQRRKSSATHLLPLIFIHVLGGSNVSLAFDLGCETSPRAVNDPSNDEVVVVLTRSVNMFVVKVTVFEYVLIRLCNDWC